MVYICKKCNVTFLWQFELIIHRYCHRNDNEACEVCALCDEKCINLDHLKNHVNQHVQSQKFLCASCGKQFVYEGGYLYHVQKRVCLNDCVLCNKIFANKRDLINHIRLHTRETPYKCGVCNKGFLRKSHLEVHERTHMKIKKENVRPKGLNPTKDCFKCNYCQKQYSRKEHLQMHVRSHTGDLFHICEYCGVKFWRPDHLKQHQKIHKYDVITKHCSCVVCGERFSKYVLKTHMIEHHSETTKFNCSKCNKSFKKKGNLIFHQRTHDHQLNVVHLEECKPPEPLKERQFLLKNIRI